MSGTTTSISGLPAASSVNLIDKIPVDQITNGVSNTKYVTPAQIISLFGIPPATSSTIGGIIVGSNLTITSGGVLSATSTPYTLPTATTSSLGGIIVGNNLTITNGVLSANAAGSTAPATTTSLGLVQIGSGLNVTSGLISVVYGTASNTAAQGNDSRITGAAPLASPAFTGTATLVTPPTTNATTNAIASTGYVNSLGFLTSSSLPVATSSALGVVKPDGTTITNSTGTISVTYGTTANTAVQGNDSRLTGVAYLAGAVFTGVVAAPTPLTTDNSTTLATTAFVTAKVAASTAGVSQVLGNTGSVTLSQLVTGGVAPLASPTFTGTVTIPGGASISGYATLASPTFTGTVTIPAGASITGYLTSATASTTYAPINNPTFTGSVTIPAGASIPGFATTASPTFTGVVTIPAGAAISGYAPLASPTFTGTVTIPTGAVITGYAPIANPTFTGTVTIPAGAAISGFAPLASPTFTGTPLLTTTPSPNDNSLKVADTQYVDRAVAASTSGISSVAGQTGSPTAGIVTLANLISGGVAPIASPTFTGVPAAPTAAGGTNTTQLATTAFVTAAVAASTTGVSSVIGNTGAVTLAQLVTGGVAPIASPTFTGTVTIPGGASISGYATLAGPTFTGTVTIPAGAAISGYATLASPTFTGTVTIPAGASISGFAPLASPTFTGVPAAPTATTGTNTTQVATTAFVAAAVAASTTGVSSVIGNTGAVTLAQLVTGGVAPIASPTFTGTVTIPAGAAISGYATLAGNPAFSGVPTLATTPTAGSNSVQIANTNYVDRAISNFSVSPTITGTPVISGYLTTAAASSTYAPIANPTFTGTVNLTGATATAATPANNSVSTAVATTGYVANQLSNSVVGTLLTGNGTPGVVHVDSAGNVNIINAYPFPIAMFQSVAAGVTWQWYAPVNVTLTSITVILNNTSTSSNGVTVSVGLNGLANITGLTSCSVNGSTTVATFTATTATAVSSGNQIAIQVASITGTIPTLASVVVQMYGNYA